MRVTSNQAWGAIEARDRRFDGQFVYAVLTTGVYNRPSCPSRQPRRENVVFYLSALEAEKAGYRACYRCCPSHLDGTPAERAVEHARAFIEAHLDELVTLEMLSSVVPLSSFHLQRTFKRIVGLSPKQYQIARRLEVFKDTVGETRDVLAATFEAGFGSSRALYEGAGSKLGMTPGAYRRGGAGLSIRYILLASTLGRLLVAVTAQGVCAVSLGDDDERLVAELKEEFPNASLIHSNDDKMTSWADSIVRYLEGVPLHPTVPVALQGTDFQRLVWRKLQEIPYGETRSYSEVASMVGRPAAARAVAQACANNKVALVVPCHRVVRKDGSPGGYRWGSDRKERLLEKEKTART